MKATLLGTAFLFASVLGAQGSYLDVTYSGTVGYSYDLTGVLGSTGSDVYDGQPFAVSYTFDTARGATYSGPTLTNLYGGTLFYPPVSSPLVVTTLTVGNQSVSFGTSTFNGQLQAYVDQWTVEAMQTSGGNSEMTATSNSDSQLPLSITIPFSTTELQQNNYANYFSLSDAGTNVYVSGDPTQLSLSVSNLASNGPPSSEFGFEETAPQGGQPGYYTITNNSTNWWI